MSYQEKNNLALHERLIFKLFSQRLDSNLKTKSDDDPHHIISETEQKAIKKLYWQALTLAAIYGTLGVLLLYLPGVFFPEGWLSQTAHTYTLDLPYLDQVPISVPFTIYGVILAVLEIIALMQLNLWVVRRIATICNFPDFESPNYERHLKMLFEVGLEKRDKSLLKFGINPLAGLSRFKLLLYSLLNILKATLSNLIIKVLLYRVLGRFAIRVLIDLIGVPVFSFWNMYATHRVIREAKIRIMAPNLIKELSQQMEREFKDNKDFNAVLYDILQFIASAKRSFHHNHLLLVESLHNHLQFDYEKKTSRSQEEILSQIKQMPQYMQEGLAKLFTFGMLIDGTLSRREAAILGNLKQELELSFDYEQLKQWESDFIEGRGLGSFFNEKILTVS